MHDWHGRVYSAFTDTQLTLSLYNISDLHLCNGCHSVPPVWESNVVFKMPVVTSRRQSWNSPKSSFRERRKSWIHYCEGKKWIEHKENCDGNFLLAYGPKIAITGVFLKRKSYFYFLLRLRDELFGSPSGLVKKKRKKGKQLTKLLSKWNLIGGEA